MKILVYSVFILFLALAFVSVAKAEAAETGGDVYNFYFQKAPGPMTVIQGGEKSGDKKSESLAAEQSGENKEVQKTSAEQTSAQSAQTATSQVADLDKFAGKWQIHLGFAENKIASVEGTSQDSRMSFFGYAFGAEYNFDRYFLAGGRLVFAPKSTDEGRYGVAGLERRDPYDGALFGGFTPLRLGLLGNTSLEIVMTFGVLTTTSRARVHQSTSYGYVVDQSIEEDKTWVPFVGTRLAMNFGSYFALVAEHRYPRAEDGYGQFEINGRVTF